MKGRVAFISDGSRHPDRDTILSLTDKDVRIALLGSREAELQQLAAEVEARGGNLIYEAGDAADPEAVGKMLQRIRQRWERLDLVLVYSGLPADWSPTTALGAETLDQSVNHSLLGIYHMVTGAAAEFQRNGGSAFVIAAAEGREWMEAANPFACSYFDSAQTSLTRMLALELAERNMNINLVRPDHFRKENAYTNQTDLLNQPAPSHLLDGNRMTVSYGEGETLRDPADLFLSLAADESRYITGMEIHLERARTFA
jgi:NAD(P)-dependent dehydrogenase (short-subunit alcohol dehydrogenase family)